MTGNPNPSAVPDVRPKVWKTALLLAGSAAFGGLAVALWNRRELTQMQNQRDNPCPQGSPDLLSEQTEEEIF
jgi:uncharacterized membrane protein YebE (DUF533 family)